MPIDFVVTDTKKVNFRKGRKVEFTNKIRSYFITCENDFPDSIAILTKLDEYDDSLLSHGEVKELLELCDLLLKSTGNIADYGMYAKWKPFNISREDMQRFAYELSELLKYAVENNKSIWCVGD